MLRSLTWYLRFSQCKGGGGIDRSIDPQHCPSLPFTSNSHALAGAVATVPNPFAIHSPLKGGCNSKEGEEQEEEEEENKKDLFLFHRYPPHYHLQHHTVTRGGQSVVSEKGASSTDKPSSHPFPFFGGSVSVSKEFKMSVEWLRSQLGNGRNAVVVDGSGLTETQWINEQDEDKREGKKGDDQEHSREGSQMNMGDEVSSRFNDQPMVSEENTAASLRESGIAESGSSPTTRAKVAADWAALAAQMDANPNTCTSNRTVINDGSGGGGRGIDRTYDTSNETTGHDYRQSGKGEHTRDTHPSVSSRTSRSDAFLPSISCLDTWRAKAVALLLSLCGRDDIWGPYLIICPRSRIDQWHSLLDVLAPTLRVLKMVGFLHTNSITKTLRTVVDEGHRDTLNNKGKGGNKKGGNSNAKENNSQWQANRPTHLSPNAGEGVNIILMDTDTFARIGHRLSRKRIVLAIIDLADAGL